MRKAHGRRGLLLLFSFILIIADQIVKRSLLKYPPGSLIAEVVPNFLYIRLILNRGIAFGLLPQLSKFFTLFNFGIVLYLLYLFFKLEKGIYLVCLGLILAGAVSNLIDRLSYGAVIDYIDFKFWPTFNLADTYITIGIIFILKDAIPFRKGAQA